MNKKIVQLGYGKMGRVVLDDLLKTAEFDELVVADAGAGFSFNIEMVRDPRVKAVVLNVDDKPALINLLRDAAVVIELLPIRYTMQVAQAGASAIKRPSVFSRNSWMTSTVLPRQRDSPCSRSLAWTRAST